MELTGLQIFKYLPGGRKTENANCKQCKQPTCMAYALKLAKKQVEPDVCPYLPDELKTLLFEACKKQQNEIIFGANNQTKIGGETVMFRHEKTLVNKTIIAIELNCDDEDFDEKYFKIKNYELERVGEKFNIETIYLLGKKDIELRAKQLTEDGFSLIIKTENPETIDKLNNLNPIFETESECPQAANIIISSQNIDEITEKYQKIHKIGHQNLVINLDISTKPISTIVEELTYIRRLAILNREESFAHPVMTKIPENLNHYEVLTLASILLCRYSNIIVIKDIDYATITSLLTLRQSIYTDPQKPLQVEPKVYEFNEPDENAIIMMTTNFALTYFAVANEIESMNKPTYLIVTPSDGMSVLTAWSADKFTSELAAKTLKESNLAQKVKNKKIIIPGLLSHMKEELEEELKEWEILVGPIEAYQLPEFVKNNF